MLWGSLSAPWACEAISPSGWFRQPGRHLLLEGVRRKVHTHIQTSRLETRLVGLEASIASNLNCFWDSCMFHLFLFLAVLAMFCWYQAVRGKLALPKWHFPPPPPLPRKLADRPHEDNVTMPELLFAGLHAVLQHVICHAAPSC